MSAVSWIQRSSTTIGQPWEISVSHRGLADRPVALRMGSSSPGGWWAGRESNPHSRKTADLQSAELTTCSTYPRESAARNASPIEAGVYRTAMGASTDAAVPPQAARQNTHASRIRWTWPGVNWVMHESSE